MSTATCGYVSFVRIFSYTSTCLFTGLGLYSGPGLPEIATFFATFLAIHLVQKFAEKAPKTLDLLEELYMVHGADRARRRLMIALGGVATCGLLSQLALPWVMDNVMVRYYTFLTLTHTIRIIFKHFYFYPEPWVPRYSQFEKIVNIGTVLHVLFWAGTVSYIVAGGVDRDQMLGYQCYFGIIFGISSVEFWICWKDKQGVLRYDSLHCEICFYPFNRADRTPRILKACGHTICKDCVWKLLDREQVVCPFCRATTGISRGIINSFPKNFTVMSMLN